MTTATKLVNLEDYLTWLIGTHILNTTPLTDVACMLLSNLSKLRGVCEACLHLQVEQAQLDPVASLQKLVDLFAKQEGEGSSAYNYLANVFANISAANVGPPTYLAESNPEKLCRYRKAGKPFWECLNLSSRIRWNPKYRSRISTLR